MGRSGIKQRIQKVFSVLIILFFLPYVVSVFINGKELSGDAPDDPWYVKVETDGEGSGYTEVEWTRYLAGILAEEVQPDCGQEALKALAVLIRTRICRDITQSGDNRLSYDYMTFQDIRDEYGDESGEKFYGQYLQAVMQTDDTVLMYGDDFAYAPYYKSSTGMTRNAADTLGTDAYPYLISKECPADKESPEEIHIFTFSYSQIQEKCREFLVAESDEKAQTGYVFSDFQIESVDEAGYVTGLRIGSTVCTGDQFRNAMGLSSSAFTFSEAEDGIKVTVTGNGHGLGMSLWTAGKMAEEGADYQDILSYFFDGTELRRDIQENQLI